VKTLGSARVNYDLAFAKRLQKVVQRKNRASVKLKNSI
jgi:hypothetical protein